ncbi:sodium:proton antiporter [Fulvitalea axinellae]|uniref:Sodium:proton antiporter n=1 Tax=Fulvitalea axinellae TaxID=1182444 RepID=A0AAU9CVI6_9BACT|nr:sodium:proton antiporter [Fulvitalea axinellae]
MLVYLIPLILLLGYSAITMERWLSVNKAALALLTGVAVWLLYLSVPELVSWPPHEVPDIRAERESISERAIVTSTGEIAEIIFFLMAALTIVELINGNGGFDFISRLIRTRSRKKLIWVFGLTSFFLSALLDNLTVTIIMVALSQSLVANEEKFRWKVASVILISANAGGVWSPIGDVTTIMLWVDGKLSTGHLFGALFIPSFVAAVVPLIILSPGTRGLIDEPQPESMMLKGALGQSGSVFAIGVLGLLTVPMLRGLTDLPPFLGMQLALALLWIYVDVTFKAYQVDFGPQLQGHQAIRRIDMPTILFFLGILLAVDGMEATGHFGALARWLKAKVGDVFLINGVIGVLSAIVDNVPLVAASVEAFGDSQEEVFDKDGAFWTFLAYSAGTGGSLTIIGSAAGVAAMGLEQISFGWYLKKMAPLALAGFLSGALMFISVN